MGTRLKGKVALVTGAASGMGCAIAMRYAREGASVSMVDINKTDGEQVVRTIRDTGGQADFVRCDVSKGDDVKAAVAATIRRFGKLHILVNAAGIVDQGDVLIADMTEEAWDRTMAVNLKGPFYFSRYAIPEIVTCGGGSVINIASVAGMLGADRCAYAASKGALIALTRNVARQFGPEVRVNAICPGPIETPLLQRFRAIRAEKGDTRALTLPVMLERTGRAEEIADAACFLASDDSSYITSAVIPVDGGLTGM